MYTIVTGKAVSADAGYDMIDPDDVSIINRDDDVAGYNVSAASNHTAEDGTSATFTVALNSQPTASVTIPVTSSDAAEGTPDTKTLLFTTSNWSTPQTVTVTGVDDQVADGSQSYTIKLGLPTTADTAYASLDPNDVALVNDDDDTSGLRVIAPTTNETGEATGFGDVTFSVVLRSRPLASVTVPLMSTQPSEGDISSPVSAQLVFTTSNWDVAQSVTVTGVDDLEEDGDKPYAIQIGPTTSSDPAYDGLMPAAIMLSNVDDEQSSGP